MPDNNFATKGKWKKIKPIFKNLPVHMALLHTGQVIGIGGSGNNPHKLKEWDKPEIFTPDYTGKTDGTIEEISDTGVTGDIFCVGQSFLPDGRLFLAGGTHKYDGLFGFFPPFSGLDHTYIFDPETTKFTKMDDMKHGRWYPTCVMLSNGDIATFSGLTKRFPWLIFWENELFSFKNNKWSKLEGANKFLPLYPRIHLLPSGELFYAGSYNTHLTFPFTLYGFKIGTFKPGWNKWKKLPYPKETNRQEGASVLLPLLPEDCYQARVILIGGGDTFARSATKSVEMIDFSETSEADLPKYRPINSMQNPRYYVYAVILPDQNVLVVGGKRGHHGFSAGNDNDSVDKTTVNPKPQENAVLDAELFITKERKWKTLARMKVDRLYHSNAILLQDGTIMTAGSNPARGCNEHRVEIFYPPYLAYDTRPEIKEYPKKINYNETITIKAADDAKIKTVSLIKPSATTHCLNPEQRYVGLEFEQSSDVITAKIPGNRNVVPPGYYMLFITNEKDTPCISPFVQVLM